MLIDDPTLLAVKDMNLDGTAEILYSNPDCTVGCMIYYDILEWNGKEFASLAHDNDPPCYGPCIVSGSAEIVDLRTLRPLDMEPVLESFKKTNRAIVVEEGWKSYGVGSEVVSRMYEQAFDYVDAPILRVAQKEVPLPYNRTLEQAALPQVPDIVATLLYSSQDFLCRDTRFLSYLYLSPIFINTVLLWRYNRKKVVFILYEFVVVTIHYGNFAFFKTTPTISINLAGATMVAGKIVFRTIFTIVEDIAEIFSLDDDNKLLMLYHLI